jgi:hypothetical protein
MSDDWHYSHKTVGGHDINAYGYDKNGVYRGTAPFQSNDYNQTTQKNKSKSKATAGSGLVGFVLFIIILYKVLEFLENNWISVVAIIGVILLCLIFCLVIRKKTSKVRLAIFLSIIVSIGLIIGIIYLGPVQDDGNFERWNKNFTTNAP